MAGHRIIYALLLAISAFFYVVYPYWFSWYLLVLAVLILPFDLIVSILGMLKGRVFLSAPELLEQGADGELVIVSVRENSFPAGLIKFYLRIKNDDGAAFPFIRCGSPRGSRYVMNIDTLCSGLTIFEIKRIWATSLLGFFSIPLISDCRACVLILPTPIKPPYSITLPYKGILRPKTGGGFSEEHDLREYRPGDRQNIIHWKLSAKRNQLIVREALAMPPQSRLVLIMPWNTPAERDLILGRLMWISNYLLGRDLPHYVRFHDDGPAAEIAQSGDLTSYLRGVLDDESVRKPDPAPLPARFTWVFRADAKEAPK